MPRPLPKCLKPSEVRRLLKAVNSRRDRAMFLVMLRCGLRVEEVAKLTKGALDLELQTLLVVNGKGGKDRMVYVSDDALKALIDYIKTRPRSRCRQIFLVEKGRCKGKAISVRGIQKRMEYYARKTGINVSCHKLRHTMATQMLNAEADLVTIQDLLGHSTITTTQRYCKVSNLRVQRDYFKSIRVVVDRQSGLNAGSLHHRRGQGSR